ncbi:amidohydrolase [Caminicella sporogenes DSM 14501]|uniref:Amidohydrolase n=1 Tax=Caminicella sporogenes DSM 14501 TaxID=1121266 RepID=A0A1M6SX29_9FIRM|nr:amidohydrolase [Caminicella sporogenes]RKD21929.1 amidohydrolase [Caminicella sporogenes]SHK49275.1 amidohydrolase [Caminicella sporogenes DSM 14501]
MFKEKILKKAEEIKEELISIRRDIHSHPEIGLQEKRTSALVAEKLKKLDIEVKTNVGITGVIGLLKGKYPGKTILLRADMDCLEMTELNDIEYKSKYPGLMHACGHDAHTTWLLGAAMILSEFKDELHGNVKFLFQPAEESQGGANRMINEGVLENPKVDAAIGAHVWPIVESGKIGIKYGSMMAAPDKFTLTIYGKGGHGAEPHNCIDPISIACQAYMSLQTIVSRKINPIEPAVISITMFNAGSAHNVIPDRVEMVGTVRTLTNELREEIPKMMESIIKGITEANGGSYEFEYIPYYPPVINNDEITDVVKHAGEEILGKDNVVELKNPTMGGEDFSYFQQKVPGAFFVVGTYNENKKITKPLHSPYFNIDEDILSKASAVLAESALLYLNK